MSNEISNKTKLKYIIETKRIARSGLDNAYLYLEEWKKYRKTLNNKKNRLNIDTKINLLEIEIDKIEQASANMEYGDCGDGGGFGGGGSDICGSAGH